MLARGCLLASLALLTAVACSETPSAPSNPLPQNQPAGSGGGTSSGEGGAGGEGGAAQGGGGTGGAPAGSGGNAGSGASGSGGRGNAGGGGDGGSGNASSSSGSGGAGGGCTEPGKGPVIVDKGQPGRILLKGTIVTPDDAFDGEVLVDGDTIACAAPSCAGEPGASNATVVDTKGIVFPGLIDAHNHILFDIFDETHWSPTKAYDNHDQWPNEPRYSAMLDAKQYLNGEGSSPVDYNCELNKYGELKALVAGTTSVVGAANPANKKCYGSLARTIDQTANDLGDDKIQVATLFPTKSAADGVCENFKDGDTDAYVIHVGEGVDEKSLKEFASLGTVTTEPKCLYSSKTTIVHGTAFGEAELSTMAAAGMSLVWSPRSNVFLYGAGTDYTKTTNVPLALKKGINVALAPDWSMGGSQNLLDELRFANQLDDAAWGDILSPKTLVQMVTKNAAKALGLAEVLGSIAPGMKADLMVVSGDPKAPYAALLAATPRQVQLVMVNGVVLYGEKPLEPIAPAQPGCEPIDICGCTKFVCVAETSAADKLNQTYAEIAQILNDALSAYDALDLSMWDFAPITPVVRCD